MIEQWFINKGSYVEGLELLRLSCGGNKRMYLRLKNSKDTQRNLAALKYELNKYRNKTIEMVSKPVKVASKITTTEHAENLKTSSLKKANTRITMAMLPDAKLRDRFAQKNKAYYERWELKKTLNSLPEDEEEKALEIIVKIMNLTSLIDSIWKELDYYIEHKQIMPTGRDFSNLSNLELFKTRQRLYQSRSKRQKTLDKLQSELPGTPKEKRLALQSKIDSKTKKITQINIEIEKISELIINE